MPSPPGMLASVTRMVPLLLRYSAPPMAGLVIVALVVGLAVPTVTDEPPSALVPADPRPAPVFVAEPILRPEAEAPWAFDPESGRRRDLALPGRGQLWAASFSTDPSGAGGWHLVGLWSERTSPLLGPDRQVNSLIRLDPDSGRIRDRLPLPESGTVPRSHGPFCWHSGSPARVLFAGNDGRLYEADFEPGHSPSTGRPAGPTIRRLAWETDRPGGDRTRFFDPSMATAPGSSATIVVSTMIEETGRRGRKASQSEVWWLRLDDSRSTVEEAGRLARIAPDGPDPAAPGPYVRHPVIGTTADGCRVLALLRSQPDRPGLALQVLPVSADPETKALRARPPREPMLAEQCEPVPPAFSRDGRWIRVVCRRDDGGLLVRRVAIPGGCESDASKAEAAPRRLEPPRQAHPM